MHFKTFFITIAILLFVSSCDKPLILEEIKVPVIKYTDEVDSSYRKIKIRPFDTSSVRTFYVLTAKSNYHSDHFKHHLLLSDSSTIDLYTEYKLYQNRSFDARDGLNFNLYTGKVIVIDFYDKKNRQHYDFRTQADGVITLNTIYKNDYSIVQFDDVTLGWPGYAKTIGEISGQFAIKYDDL